MASSICCSTSGGIASSLTKGVRCIDGTSPCARISASWQRTQLATKPCRSTVYVGGVCCEWKRSPTPRTVSIGRVVENPSLRRKALRCTSIVPVSYRKALPQTWSIISSREQMRSVWAVRYASRPYSSPVNFTSTPSRHTLRKSRSNVICSQTVIYIMTQWWGEKKKSVTHRGKLVPDAGLDAGLGCTMEEEVACTSIVGLGCTAASTSCERRLGMPKRKAMQR